MVLCFAFFFSVFVLAVCFFQVFSVRSAVLQPQFRRTWCISQMSGSKSFAEKGAEGDILSLAEIGGITPKNSTCCLVGKVLSTKSFNAFGFLEAMKKAMRPSKGFIAREVGQNLFTFQFHSDSDLKDVLNREPWLFDKNLLLLKELEMGEQPSQVRLDSTALWMRVYDLPAGARSNQAVTAIAKLSGEVLEIDQNSMVGITRHIRVKVRVNISQPLKKGMSLDLGNNITAWIPFKYERLPSFCFVCGAIGHMRRECDLTDSSQEILDLSEEELPYGEWMRVSPLKKAVVTTSEIQRDPASNVRKALFENFRKSVLQKIPREEEEGTESITIRETHEVKALGEKLRNVIVTETVQNAEKESMETQNLEEETERQEIVRRISATTETTPEQHRENKEETNQGTERGAEEERGRESKTKEMRGNEQELLNPRAAGAFIEERAFKASSITPPTLLKSHVTHFDIIPTSELALLCKMTPHIDSQPHPYTSPHSRETPHNNPTITEKATTTSINKTNTNTNSLTHKLPIQHQEPKSTLFQPYTTPHQNPPKTPQPHHLNTPKTTTTEEKTITYNPINSRNRSKKQVLKLREVKKEPVEGTRWPQAARKRGGNWENDNIMCEKRAKVDTNEPTVEAAVQPRRSQ